jgi:hypothetical protein
MRGIVKLMREATLVITAALLLAGCTTLGDVKGQRTAVVAPGASVQRVDVVFLDQPTLERTGVAALLPPSGRDFMVIDNARREVRESFSDARRGVEAALVANGISGRAYLLSVPQPARAASASHVVVVSVRSVTRSSSWMRAMADIRIFDVQSKQMVWSGEAELPGAVNPTVRDAFGNGVVRALREIGIAPAGTAAISTAS